jgi:hypothetical protein
MNSDRFAKFHRRQAELGVCRCAECRGRGKEPLAAADPRAPGAYGVADGALDVFGTAAAAPFDPESVRRAFVSEPFPPGKWQERLERAKSGGGYGPESPYAPLGYEDDPEPIGPPLPGEPDMRPYRGIGPWWDTK